MATADDLELEVMAHRYLYYVEADPRLPDLVYDALERQARAVCPPESPVHGVGSCLSASYTPAQKARAYALLYG
jgi:NAD-dependent DNA ligase